MWIDEPNDGNEIYFIEKPGIAKAIKDFETSFDGDAHKDNPNFDLERMFIGFMKKRGFEQAKYRYLALELKNLT